MSFEKYEGLLDNTAVLKSSYKAFGENERSEIYLVDENVLHIIENDHFLKEHIEIIGRMKFPLVSKSVFCGDYFSKDIHGDLPYVLENPFTYLGIDDDLPFDILPDDDDDSLTFTLDLGCANADYLEKRWKQERIKLEGHNFVTIVHEDGMFKIDLEKYKIARGIDPFIGYQICVPNSLIQEIKPKNISHIEISVRGIPD